MTAPSPAELLELSRSHVTVRLTPEQYGPALSHPPFVNVPGTFNVRDLGRLPHTTTTAAPAIRPGFAFRSGMLAHLTDDGKKALTTDLGIRRIFDLRSASEHTAHPDPFADDDPAVRVIWADTELKTPHTDPAPFAPGYGEAAYADMYLGVLDTYRPTIAAVLAHIRDRPNEPFLFHCTAGRDRTGVLAGLLLALVGAPSDTIALDYMLTRLGMEPVRDMLEGFARKGASDDTSNDDAAGKSDASSLPPGFINLISLRIECWDAFLEALDKKHGGFEGFVTGPLGFSAEDVATIKKNLTTAPSI